MYHLLGKQKDHYLTATSDVLQHRLSLGKLYDTHRSCHVKTEHGLPF